MCLCKSCKNSNKDTHCAKCVLIRSYSGPYFSIFGLNTKRYSECGKTRTRINPNKETFCAVTNIDSEDMFDEDVYDSNDKCSEDGYDSDEEGNGGKLFSDDEDEP